MLACMQELFKNVFGVASTSPEGLAILMLMEIGWGIAAFYSVKACLAGNSVGIPSSKTPFTNKNSV